MAKKIVVYDTDDGSGAEPVKEFLVSDEFRIVYTDEDGYMRIAGKISNARMGTKYWIKNLFYQPVAESLCNKFDELAHILPSQILYLEDIAWKKPAGKRASECWISKTIKAEEKFCHMTGYMYISIFRSWFTEKMSKEQLIAQIYHELRHIGPEGELLKHNVEEWDNLLATLGKDFSLTKSQILNILDENFAEWDELRRAGTQISVFDGKVVDFKAKTAK